MSAFAAVDIGSNSVRLSIAELRKGKLVAVHQDREVTRLGEGVFRNGSLDPQAMARTLKVLRRFHRAVQTWAVERVRVVATSAMRDCNNAQVFREWIKSATGWNVDVISGTEEGRLIHLGVISKLRVRPAELLLIDLGGGSCELTLSSRGHIKEVVTLPLGAVRLTQEFIRHDPPSREELNRLHEFIAEEVDRIPQTIRQARVRSAIATSGTADALASAAQALKLSRKEVSAAAAVRLAKRLANMTQKQRATIKGINVKRAEIVVAGASVYAHILSSCGLKGFRYSPLGLRDGVLAQMAAEHDQGSRSHRQLESDRQDVLLNIVRRYGVDMKNAEHVRKLALSLFDQSRSLHQLERGFREWIAAAAMLYEVGSYINPVGRHRHTYYTIAHSELFGFTPLQRQIIAIIARFQGNSRPQIRDRLIKVLPAHLRGEAIKAIALLRVARTLNQGRREAVRSIKVRARGGEIILSAKTGRTGADIEMWAAGKEVPYFREVFGRELLFKMD